jgi:hypothetical protein
VFLAPGLPTAPPHPEMFADPFDIPVDTDEGWAKFNAAYWQRDYRGFMAFFFDRCFGDTHFLRLASANPAR